MIVWGLTSRVCDNNLDDTANILGLYCAKCYLMSLYWQLFFQHCPEKIGTVWIASLAMMYKNLSIYYQK